ncbi:MAG: molybdopterin-dependent oxidoreductase [Coriobacteriia bacterium]|nr:molybdopterin-dependent oxidoreductase [Coriobacteriia bacterium]
MTQALYSRRQWLAFVAALAPTLALAGCVFESQPSGTGTGGDGSTTSSAGFGSEISNYQGTQLDPYRSAKVQGINGVQQLATADYRLEVNGKTSKPLSLSYDDVHAMPSTRKLVKLPCVEGWSVVHVWDGVLLRDVLERAGYDSSASTVIFRCSDGYTTSMPLKVIIDNNVMLAWSVNGVTLPTEYGYPFRTVAENYLGYKWAKWIKTIEVSNDASFRGYWEQRGYSNVANV